MKLFPLLLGREFNEKLKANLKGTTKLIFTDVEPSNNNTVDYSINQDESILGWKNNDVYYISSLSKGEVIFGNEDMSWMFFDCPSLKLIDLSNLDTSLSTNMNSMFGGYVNEDTCYPDCDLETIIFGDKFITSNVTDMSEMFYGCHLLKTIDISKFDTSLVKDMSGMFANCESLESLTFGDNFITDKVSNMDRMFWWCSSLKSINLSNINTKTVYNINEMFIGCNNLVTLAVKDEVTKNKLLGNNSNFDNQTLIVINQS